SRQCSRQPKASNAGIVILAAVRFAAAACRRAHENRKIVPGAAANHMTRAALLAPWTAVDRRVYIGFVPAILDPLPGIAESSVKTERVRFKAIDLGEYGVVPPAAAAVAVCITRAETFAPPPRSGRAGACGILPFRLARQPVGTVTTGERGPFALCFHVQ